MNTSNSNGSNKTLSKHPVKNFVIGIFVILIFLIGHRLFAQVGVGNTNPQAQLDISASSTTSPANNDGILIPRMSNLPAIFSMTANQDGMMVFYTGTGFDGKGFYYWDETANNWIKITSGTSSDWAINGNTINGTDFLGTTNNQAIRFRTNNVQQMVLDADGDLGINQINPNATLDIDFTNGKNVIEARGNATVTAPTLIVSNISGATTSSNDEIDNGMIQSFTTTQDGELNYIDFYARGSSFGNQDTRIIIRRNGTIIYNDVFSIGYGTSPTAERVTFPTGIAITTGFTYSVEIEDVSHGFGQASIYGYYSTTNTYANGNASGNAPTGGDLAINVNINRFISTTDEVFVLDDSGRLSIGHDNPSATLDVEGDFRYSDGNEATGYMLVSDNFGNASWTDPTSIFTDTDDQTLSLTGTTLSIADGNSVNLATIQDGTGTDDQNIQNLAFNSSTNILTVGIENGTAQTVNLSALDNSGNDWSINGNTGTNPSANFIGTTDNQDLAFRTNNVEKVRITAKGQIETTQLQSVWIGEDAGNAITSGNRNVFIGRLSGTSVTTGVDNTAVGAFTLSSLSGGQDNTALGLGALFNLSNGNGNTFVGEQSGENLINGNFNTVIGHTAGESMNGSSNIFIGYEAGQTMTGNNKLVIDNDDNGTSSFIYGEMDNEILRANAQLEVTRNSSGTVAHLDLIETQANDGARIQFSNSVETTNTWTLYGYADDTDDVSRLNIFYSGSGNIMEIYGDNTVELNGQLGLNLNNPTYAVHLPNSATIGTGQGRANAWTTYSDSRVKSNQQELQNGLALINKMLPKTYFHHNGNIENGILNLSDSGEQTLGFIAQELYEILPEAVQKPDDENQSLWSVNYDKVIPVTVKAIQELNTKIKTLEAENLTLKQQLSKLKSLEERLLALENKAEANNSSQIIQTKKK